jgi:LacI family xylobiose transport system transcriptional regulator
MGRVPLTIQPLVDMASRPRVAPALARGRRPAQTRIELATELIVRESTAPPA